MTDAVMMLALAEGFGERVIPALLQHGVDPAAVLAARPVVPRSVPPAAAARLLSGDLPERAAQTLGRAEAAGVAVLTRAHPRWPRGLARLATPPLVLFARGSLEALDRAPAAAVVGSRTPTPYGVDAAAQVASALAESGATLWSGLARGVDAAAHRACLQAGVPTVAVLAGGLDEVYPPEHDALAEQISTAGGCLLSELPLGRRARRGHFLRRNRLLATAPPAVIVVEGSLTSGALHTARFAAEAGVDVHCLPGPWLSERSQGCHRLIHEGATIIESVEALLQGVGLASPGAAEALALALDAGERAVLRQLDGGPRPTDLLRRECGLAGPETLRALARLERRGAVTRSAGDLWSRAAARRR
ncbi:MAG: DNA-processing protein DprA [Planctomycetota bacterium]|nr:DNA-processing protein DprA [Planctomycetota bacterium]MEC9048126.1 DNA-processing protein DprA [Planctomycetota bacterium]